MITFDNKGVSSHLNHIAVYKAVKRIQKQLESDVKDNKVEKKDQLKIFTLETTNILRKYISVFDFFISAIYSDHLFIQLSPFYTWKAMSLHKS